MLSPNVPKLSSRYERIENTLAEMTPDPLHFRGSVYPSEEIEKDLKQLGNFKKTPEYKKSRRALRC